MPQDVMNRFQDHPPDQVAPDNDGERFVPSAPAAELALEHWHRYLFAAQFAVGKHVLDVACGVGYGSHFLAEVAACVTGVDRDQAAIAWARTHYTRPNVTFRCADAVGFKSGDHEFGLIVSFETIEHLPDFRLFLDRLQRALKPGGVLLVSTPDRKTYGLTRSAPNPHHLAEMSGEEFREALASRFSTVKLLGQRVLVGSLLATVVPEAQESPISFATLSRDANQVTTEVSAEHVYWLAVCSDNPLLPLKNSILELTRRFNPIASLLGGIAERDAEIARLRNELRKVE